ncbi:MAG: hypothetical protein HY322_14315 [Betaproteobacteria bacterium]|nr:hypothetical protein [Betaproteobacteria bacterium]
MSVKNPSDEELRDILFRFNETNVGWPYELVPFEQSYLTPEQIEYLVRLLGTTRAGDHVRQELAEIAECYCRDLWFQEKPSPSEIKRRLTQIQTSAHKLLRSFHARDDSSQQAKAFVQSYMRLATSEYARRMKEEYPEFARDTPWNFWTAYRLPSAIQSVELVEHWAESAIAIVDRESRPKGRVVKTKKNVGKTAARALVRSLAGVWRHAHGEFPGAGYSTTKREADSPFTRFTLKFIKFLRANVTADRRRHLPNIDNELSDLTADAIRGHLRTFKGSFNRLRKKEPR